MVIPYLDDWLIHHPDCQVLLCHQSQLLKTLDLVGLKVNKENSELDLVQGIQFLRLRLHPGSGESVTPRIEGPGDSSTSSVVYTSVPVHGIIQLRFRFHPTLQQHFCAQGLLDLFTPPGQ